ncbi:hypothetical protein NTJ28_001691 [Flavobacterium psychrophilum]|nr:hypothetical protein [Flavobacterium psychrophilum]EKT4510332.1 hypothetical protein [Flavobacterium psychrophilum]
MGLGNKLVISATGFPGTNKTWRFIQDAFREPLGALAKLAGDKTIITGVVNTAGVVSDGFIVYDGEIIPFQGGNIATEVTIIEAFENVNYNTDANDDTVLDSLPAYRTIYARCGTGGSVIFPFTDLTPLKTIKELSSFTLPANIVIDANYVHTDVNFTLALLNKLNGIEAGAEVNVQADWNVVNPSSDAFIKNKPVNLLSILYKGVAILGDFPNAPTATVNIYFPNVGTTNYMVLGTMHSFLPFGAAAQDLIVWFTAGHNLTTFRLGGYEPFGGSQNLRFEYLIIAL